MNHGVQNGASVTGSSPSLVHVPATVAPTAATDPHRPRNIFALPAHTPICNGTTNTVATGYNPLVAAAPLVIATGTVQQHPGGERVFTPPRTTASTRYTPPGVQPAGSLTPGQRVDAAGGGPACSPSHNDPPVPTFLVGSNSTPASAAATGNDSDQPLISRRVPLHQPPLAVNLPSGASLVHVKHAVYTPPGVSAPSTLATQAQAPDPAQHKLQPRPSSGDGLPRYNPLWAVSNPRNSSHDGSAAQQQGQPIQPTQVPPLLSLGVPLALHSPLKGAPPLPAPVPVRSPLEQAALEAAAPGMAPKAGSSKQRSTSVHEANLNDEAEKLLDIFPSLGFAVCRDVLQQAGGDLQRAAGLLEELVSASPPQPGGAPAYDACCSAGGRPAHDDDQIPDEILQMISKGELDGCGEQFLPSQQHPQHHVLGSGSGGAAGELPKAVRVGPVIGLQGLFDAAAGASASPHTAGGRLQSLCTAPAHAGAAADGLHASDDDSPTFHKHVAAAAADLSTDPYAAYPPFDVAADATSTGGIHQPPAGSHALESAGDVGAWADSWDVASDEAGAAGGGAHGWEGDGTGGFGEDDNADVDTEAGESAEAADLRQLRIYFPELSDEQLHVVLSMECGGDMDRAMAYLQQLAEDEAVGDVERRRQQEEDDHCIAASMQAQQDEETRAARAAAAPAGGHGLSGVEEDFMMNAADSIADQAAAMYATGLHGVSYAGSGEASSSPMPAGWHADGVAPASSKERLQLAKLGRMFPGMDMELIHETLVSCGSDLDRTIAAFKDFGLTPVADLEPPPSPALPALPGLPPARQLTPLHLQQQLRGAPHSAPAVNQAPPPHLYQLPGAPLSAPDAAAAGRSPSVRPPPTPPRVAVAAPPQFAEPADGGAGPSTSAAAGAGASSDASEDTRQALLQAAQLLAEGFSLAGTQADRMANRTVLHSVLQALLVLGADLHNVYNYEVRQLICQSFMNAGVQSALWAWAQREQEPAGDSVEYNRGVAHQQKQNTYDHKRGPAYALYEMIKPLRAERDGTAAQARSAHDPAERHRLWQRFSELKTTVNVLQLALDRLNHYAARSIAVENNRSLRQRFETELHGQHVAEALNLLWTELATIITNKICFWDWSIVTGKGSHSGEGGPRLLPAVEEFLMERGLNFAQDVHGGALLVKLTPKNVQDLRAEAFSLGLRTNA